MMKVNFKLLGRGLERSFVACRGKGSIVLSVVRLSWLAFVFRSLASLAPPRSSATPSPPASAATRGGFRSIVSRRFGLIQFVRLSDLEVQVTIELEVLDLVEVKFRSFR